MNDQLLYETVVRQEEYEKEKDDVAFIEIIKRRIVDKRRRQQLLLTYFGDNYGEQNFGDC